MNVRACPECSYPQPLVFLPEDGPEGEWLWFCGTCGHHERFARAPSIIGLIRAYVEGRRDGEV